MSTPIGTPIKEGFDGKEGKPTAQILKGSYFIGESPELTFKDYIKYFEQIPQVQNGITSFRDLVIGTQININVDEELPQAEQAKELLDQWNEDTGFFEKLQSLELTAEICGTALLEKLDEKYIVDVSEVDMRSIVEKNRDNFGRTLNYIQRVSGTDYVLNPEKFIEFEYQNVSKGKWALPPHHALCIKRVVNDRVMPSVLDCLITAEDAMTAIIANHAFPMVQITYDGMTDQQLEKEKIKWQKWKPGDKLLGNKQPKIDIIETAGDSKYSQYQQHMDQTLHVGIPFPVEIMTGDFTSRASSDVTKKLTMQKVKSRQLYLANKIKTALYYPILQQNGIDPKNVGLQISFGTSEPVELDANTVIGLATNNIVTVDEAREYLKQHTDFEAFDSIDQTQQDQTQQDQTQQDQTDQIQMQQDTIEKYKQIQKRAKEIKKSLIKEDYDVGYDWKVKVEEAEYQGRTVQLNKPFRTPTSAKKFAVYVKNDQGNVVIVRFGDQNMSIKRDDPQRRASFRARHNCDQQKDPTTAGYWSCKFWSSTPVSDLLESVEDLQKEAYRRFIDAVKSSN